MFDMTDLWQKQRKCNIEAGLNLLGRELLNLSSKRIASLPISLISLVSMLLTFCVAFISRVEAWRVTVGFSS